MHKQNDTVVNWFLEQFVILYVLARLKITLLYTLEKRGNIRIMWRRGTLVQLLLLWKSN